MNTLDDTMEKSACSDFAPRQRVPRRLGAFVLALFLAVSSLSPRVLAHTDVDATVALINAKLDALTAPNGDNKPSLYGPSPAATANPPATSAQLAAAIKELVNQAATGPDAVLIATVATHARPTFAAAITTAALAQVRVAGVVNPAFGLTDANFGSADEMIAAMIGASPLQAAAIMGAAADAALKRGQSAALDDINGAAVDALPTSNAAITAATITKIKALPLTLNTTTNPYPLTEAQKIPLTNLVITDAVTSPGVNGALAPAIVKASLTAVGTAVDMAGTPGDVNQAMIEEIVKASIAAIPAQRAQVAAVAFNAMYARVGGAGFITTAAQVGTGGSGAAYDAVQAATTAVTTVKTNDGNEANAIGMLFDPGANTNGTPNINYVDSIVSGAFASTTVTLAETALVMNRVVDEIKQAGGVDAATRASAVITSGVRARPDATSGLLTEALKFRPAGEVGSLAVAALLASKETGTVVQENTETGDIAALVLDKDLNVDGVTLNALGTGASAQRLAILKQLISADERGSFIIISKAVVADSNTATGGTAAQNTANTELNKEAYVNAALDQAVTDARGSETFAAITAAAVKTVPTLGDATSTANFLAGRSAGVANAIQAAHDTVIEIKLTTTTNPTHPASRIVALMQNHDDDLAVYVAALNTGVATDASSIVAAGIWAGTLPTPTILAEALNAFPANANNINLAGTVAVATLANPNDVGNIVGFAVRDNPTLSVDAVIGGIYPAKSHAPEIGWNAARYAPTAGAVIAGAIFKHTRLEGITYFSDGQPFPPGETVSQGQTRAAAAVTSAVVDAVLRFAAPTATHVTKAGYVKGITTSAITEGLNAIFGVAVVGTAALPGTAANKNDLSKKPDEIREVKGATAGSLIPLGTSPNSFLDLADAPEGTTPVTGGSIPNYVYAVLQGAVTVAKPYVEEIAEAAAVVLAVNDITNANNLRTAITNYLNSIVPLLDGVNSLTAIQTAYDLGLVKGQDNVPILNPNGQKNVAGSLAEFAANQMANLVGNPVTDITGL
jgi:hypothetical protein